MLTLTPVELLSLVVLDSVVTTTLYPKVPAESTEVFHLNTGACVVTNVTPSPDVATTNRPSLLLLFHMMFLFIPKKSEKTRQTQT